MKKNKNIKGRVFVLKEDLVIPVGTVFLTGADKREWYEDNYETIIGIHNNGIGYLTFGISDIKTRPDLFREVTND